jgi:hypothetical protein
MGFRFEGVNHAGQSWRAAGAIVTFGRQIEEIRPGRFRTDGTVASKKHDEVSPNSDHRPSPRSGLGTVRALDFAEGTKGFVDEVAESLRLSRDPRILYVIHDRRKFSSTRTRKFDAWEWRPYTGQNGHQTHGHLSVVGGELGEQGHEFAVAPGQKLVRPMPAQEDEEEEGDAMSFTAEEEAFLKELFKVVVSDMGSNANFAKSAIKDIRKDIITKGELILALRDLPQGDVDAAIAELIRRLGL